MLTTIATCMIQCYFIVLVLSLLPSLSLYSLQLDHPSIVKFHDSFMDKDFFCIITEYCEARESMVDLNFNRGSMASLLILGIERNLFAHASNDDQN